MNRYFIELAYNGKNYHGWQIQENAHTVQAEISDKLSTLLNEQVNVVGCGRTDTGVHARKFYAHFDLASGLADEEDLRYKLDRFLPFDIVIYKIFKVQESDHARFTAASRTYRYYISRVKDPFHSDDSYFYHGPLDLEGMKAACSDLVGQQDFTSFSRLHTQTNNNVCQIHNADWTEQGSMLIFEITADRFLRNMVRAIVGTMIEIGKGNLKATDMKPIIASQDRAQAGFSAPAHGLALEDIEYDFIDEKYLLE